MATINKINVNSIEYDLNADTVDNKHASDFATSAQGTKADNALPKAGGNLSGHIYLTGAKPTSSTGSTS